MAIKKLKANGHIVQVDWNQQDSSQMDYIHNKPTIPENIATEEFVTQNTTIITLKIWEEAD